MSKKTSEEIVNNVVLLDLAKVKPNKDNPRIIKDAEFGKLVKSLKEFPAMLKVRPLVLNEDNTILGGNMRYEAAKELKMKQVPVIYAKDFTTEQVDEFIIKDNIPFGAWDWDLLANHFDGKQLFDWGLNNGAEFNTARDSFDIAPGESSLTGDKKEPKKTDNEYSSFELVMLHGNKVKLVEMLDRIKTEWKLNSIEESIMHLISLYKSKA